MSNIGGGKERMESFPNVYYANELIPLYPNKLYAFAAARAITERRGKDKENTANAVDS